MIFSQKQDHGSTMLKISVQVCLTGQEASKIFDREIEDAKVVVDQDFRETGNYRLAKPFVKENEDGSLTWSDQHCSTWTLIDPNGIELGTQMIVEGTLSHLYNMWTEPSNIPGEITSEIRGCELIGGELFEHYGNLSMKEGGHNDIISVLAVLNEDVVLARTYENYQDPAGCRKRLGEEYIAAYKKMQEMCEKFPKVLFSLHPMPVQTNESSVGDPGFVVQGRNNYKIETILFWKLTRIEFYLGQLDLIGSQNPYSLHSPEAELAKALAYVRDNRGFMLEYRKTVTGDTEHAMCFTPCSGEWAVTSFTENFKPGSELTSEIANYIYNKVGEGFEVHAVPDSHLKAGPVPKTSPKHETDTEMLESIMAQVKNGKTMIVDGDKERLHVSIEEDKN